MISQLPLPLGAHVVVPGASADSSGSSGRGVAGRVVQRRDGAYGVALVDGRTTEVPPDQLIHVGHEEQDEQQAPAYGHNTELVTEHTILAAVVGQSADHADGDTELDIRGVYQAPTSAFWSLSKPPKHVAGPGPSWFSWEVERFCELGLKANPGCLEVLWSPQMVWADELGHELIDLRGAFLSQEVVPAYSEYVLTQFKKLNDSESDPDEQRWRRSARVLRVLIEGASLLRTGEITSMVADHRDGLEAVRSGLVAWDQVEAWRVELQQSLEEAGAASFLPPEPDFRRVDAWLRDLRRR